MKILGRDPAFWLSLFAALVMGVSTFLFPFTDDQQGVLNAVAVAIVGILTALSVHDGVVAAVVGFFKALLALGLSFGLHLTPEQQYVLMLIIQAIGTGFVRTQVTAKVPPRVQAATPVRVVTG